MIDLDSLVEALHASPYEDGASFRVVASEGSSRFAIDSQGYPALLVPCEESAARRFIGGEVVFTRRSAVRSEVDGTVFEQAAPGVARGSRDCCVGTFTIALQDLSERLADVEKTTPILQSTSANGGRAGRRTVP